jgi:hypothetical protein
MSKSIDFTKPGGFPLTQDQLDYLQAAYTECVNVLASLGAKSGMTAPFILNGMQSTVIGGTTTVSAGWFFYNGHMVRFPSQSYGTVITGNAMYVVVTPTATPLTYNDGSMPNVIEDVTGVLASLVSSTPTDATHFQLSALVPFGAGFGVNNREQVWQSIAVSTAPADGGVTGTVYFKKDNAANTLQIRGVLAANNAQNFAASPGALYSVMGTLPTGYIPNNSAYFSAYYFVSSLIKDDLGIAWIKHLTCGINTTGQLYVNWIRPDVSILGYAIDFNTIIPLD